MSDTGTVLIVAFGGGLAGAVLQPVVQYALDRLRSGHERRLARERSLRRMLLPFLAYADRLALAAGFTAAYKANGKESPLSKSALLDSLTSHEQLPAWEVVRIEDNGLRALCEELYQVVSMLMPGVLSDTDATPDQLNAEAKRLTDVRTSICLRMDALDWPEVD